MRLELPGGGGKPKRCRACGAQRAIPDQRAARALAAAGAHDGKGDLARQQLVIGQPLGGLVIGDLFGACKARSASLKPGQPRRSQNAGVVPFGHRGQALQRAQSGAAHDARNNARRERPDRLDPGEIIRLQLRNDIIRVRHHQPVEKFFELAGNDQLGADRELHQPCGMEQHDLGKTGLIADDDAVRLRLLRGQLMADHLDPQGCNHSRPCIANFGRRPAVQKIRRQVKQHVAHRVALHQPGNKRRKLRPETGQGCNRRAQGERISGVTG